MAAGDNAYTSCHTGLTTWLVGWPDVPVNPSNSRPLIDYQGATFKPLQGTAWVRELFDPETPNKTLGADRLTHMRGAFRITIFDKKGNGTGPVERLADSVMRRFKVGAGPIIHDTVRVRLSGVWREANVTTRDSVLVPVVVRWHAFTDKF